MRASSDHTGSADDDRMWFRFQSSFDGAIGAHLDGVRLLLDPRPLVNAQIETRKADRRLGHTPRDAPLTFRVIGNDFAGRHQVEIVGIPKPEVVTRELRSGVGIPRTPSADIINLVSGILDDRAFVVKLHFVIAPGFERPRSNHQEEIVTVVANQVGAQGFGLEHFGGSAVNGSR